MHTYTEVERNYYLKNREKILLKSKLYYQINKKELAPKRKEWAQKNRLKVRQYQDKIPTEKKTEYKKHYRQANEERRKAHYNLQYAVKAGKIKKSPCKICQEPKVQGHHYLGYSKENQLKVWWLCDLHHRKEHNDSISR